MVTMKDLIGRSSKATCGIMEREATIASRNLGKAISSIKKSGTHQFIGSGPGLGKRQSKVWFIRRGGF